MNNRFKLLILSLISFWFSAVSVAQNIPSYVPAQGLIGWWPFNGNANDESGNGNHGTVNGVVLTADRYGNSEKAYYFRGSDFGDYISTNALPPIGNLPRTISFWAKPEKASGGFSVFSYGKGGLGLTFCAGLAYYGNVSNFHAAICDAATYYESPAFGSGWNFYSVVVPAGAIKQSDILLYFNGQAVNLVPPDVAFYHPDLAINTSNEVKLNFGRLFYDPTQNFKGSLDDFSVFNRALNQSEINQLYQAGLPYSISLQRSGNCAGGLVSINASTSVFLTSSTATSISNTTAVSGGNIINQGGQTITQRGVCWSTSPNPTVSLITKTSDGAGAGSFSSSLTGLSASTTYYARAYATTAAGTWYGNEISFMTGFAVSANCGAPNVHSPSLSYGSMTDQEGNVYKTILIGSQEWMAENLKTRKYRNGNIIPLVSDNISWAALTTGASSWQANDSSNNACPYGRLYNWYAVDDPRGLCPTGWHVPTDVEWTSLEDNLGGYLVAGGKLKSLSTLWNSPNLGAANSTGFSALPGGARTETSTYFDLNSAGYWWTSTIYPPNLGWFHFCHTVNTASNRNGFSKKGGFSVRCLKD